MNIWDEIQNEVKLRIEAEASLEPYLNQLILSQDNLINSVAAVLASKLNSDALSSDKIKEFILDVYHKCDHIEEDLINDIVFFKDHDPACKYFSTKDTDLLNYILFNKESKDFYLSSNKNTYNDIVGLQEGFGLYIE